MESPYFVLYKLSNNEMLYWREIESNKKTVTICKGKVGELGNILILKDSLFSNLRKKYNKEIIETTSNGYRELEEGEYDYLNVEFDLPSDEYKVNNEYYLEVKKFIENILVNTALGFTLFEEFEMYDEGILEITCQVVNHIMTKELLEKSLKNSKYSNYRKIYEHDFR